jgi:hypothetical protein
MTLYEEHTETTLVQSVCLHNMLTIKNNKITLMTIHLPRALEKSASLL